MTVERIIQYYHEFHLSRDAKSLLALEGDSDERIYHRWQAMNASALYEWIATKLERVVILH